MAQTPRQRILAIVSMLALAALLGKSGLEPDASRWTTFFAGMMFGGALVHAGLAVAAIFSSDRGGEIASALLRLEQKVLPFVLGGIAAGTVLLLGFWSLRAGWTGWLLFGAILILVCTTVFGLGGHRPLINWFHAVRRKT